MKIAFLGAGSTVFAKNVLGDCIITPELGEFEIALYDIDAQRLDDSYNVLNAINAANRGKAEIKRYSDPVGALKGADFVINAIQVGGYKPCTVTDFEIPKKYGLRQTIADTLGIGGIFRALRTIPVLEDYAAIIEKVAPNALFLNYTNPMAILTGYMQRYTAVKTVGLCHSVQVCLPMLAEWLDMPQLNEEGVSHRIAGINHMAWLLEVKDKDGNDLYPEIKKRFNEVRPACDLVRLDIMNRFGYYNTESSEHTAEYHPWYIKSRYPELIEKYNIPLDEYIRRCENQIKFWGEMRGKLLAESKLEHAKSHEFGARIIQAMITDVPCRIHGNVLNTGLITNLPQNACVEVPIMIDRNGLNPCYVGELPEQCAALNRSNINTQLLTIQAAKTRKKEYVYMAAYTDPHTAAELSLDDIKSLCDDLFGAHKDWLPEYK